MVAKANIRHLQEVRDRVQKYDENGKAKKLGFPTSAFTSLSIAAVVQAINMRQKEMDGADGETFAGGFAISRQAQTQIARAGPSELAVAQPRRCWLMPFDKTKKGIHRFLVVLKEEKMQSNDGAQFCVYLLDSDPGVRETAVKVRADIFKEVKKPPGVSGGQPFATGRNRSISARSQNMSK